MSGVVLRMEKREMQEKNFHRLGYRAFMHAAAQISPLGLILESVITHLHEKKISTVHEGVRRNPSTAFQTFHARLVSGSPLSLTPLYGGVTLIAEDLQSGRALSELCRMVSLVLSS
jgi:hypothetical protein